MSDGHELVWTVHRLLKECETGLAKNGVAVDALCRYVSVNTFTNERKQFNQELINIAQEVINGTD